MGVKVAVGVLVGVKVAVGVAVAVGVFVAVNVAVVILRFRMPDHPRPFRSPWAIGRVPVLPIFGLASVLVMIPALQWQAILLGVGLAAIGLAVYALLTHARGRPRGRPREPEIRSS